MRELPTYTNSRLKPIIKKIWPVLILIVIAPLIALYIDINQQKEYRMELDQLNEILNAERHEFYKLREDLTKLVVNPTHNIAPRGTRGDIEKFISFSSIGIRINRSAMGYSEFQASADLPYKRAFPGGELRSGIPYPFDYGRDSYKSFKDATASLDYAIQSIRRDISEERDSLDECIKEFIFLRFTLRARMGKYHSYFSYLGITDLIDDADINYFKASVSARNEYLSEVESLLDKMTNLCISNLPVYEKVDKLKSVLR